MDRSRRRNQRGFVFLAMALAIVLLVGMLGLVFDLGRGFIAKSEAQAFVDAAALDAALRLDGSLAGIESANAAVSVNLNRWDFSSRAFPDDSVKVEFSPDKTAWLETPASGTGIRYVRVSTANNPLQIFFLPIVGAGSNLNVGAFAVAGTELGTTFQQGVFPFAPFAKDPAGPDFGYSKGDELTLLWPSNTQGNVKMEWLCKADQNQAALDAVLDGTTSDRGYIQETSTSSIAAAIEGDHMDYALTIDEPANRTGGVKNVIWKHLEARAKQDSSPTELDYDTYIANHDDTPLRRIVILPILSDAMNATVRGFVRVFLPPTQPSAPTRSMCATYIGPADAPPGFLGNGANLIRLVQ